MKFFKNQYALDFDQPNWKNDPELYVMDQILEKIRTDSTAIETNIHHPTNASLLWDCIRVAGRLLQRTHERLKTVTFRSYQKVVFRIAPIYGFG